jgi:hypothetical protein
MSALSEVGLRDSIAVGDGASGPQGDRHRILFVWFFKLWHHRMVFRPASCVLAVAGHAALHACLDLCAASLGLFTFGRAPIMPLRMVLSVPLQFHADSPASGACRPFHFSGLLDVMFWDEAG